MKEVLVCSEGDEDNRLSTWAIFKRELLLYPLLQIISLLSPHT